MAEAYFDPVLQIMVTPRDEATCVHHWSYHTYTIGSEVKTKKLCFYCKKVEEV